MDGDVFQPHNGGHRPAAPGNPLAARKRYRFRITNYRIDFERGLLAHNIDTLELWHVEDLRFHQSLMARILGVGTITVLSKHPTTPMLIIPSIPNAQALFKTLEQRVIAVKRQAGVIKVDTGNVGTTRRTTVFKLLDRS